MEFWVCLNCGLVLTEYEHDELEEVGYRCPRCDSDIWDVGDWENPTTFKTRSGKRLHYDPENLTTYVYYRELR